jgi:NADH-quinone oxidoreductase subunit F
MIMRLLTDGIGEADLADIGVYRARGGYRAVEKALRTMTPAEVSAEVMAANLRGRGGAGFPAGRKWSFLPNDGRPRYLAVNGDESEPGSYSNRMLIEQNPHLLVEGVICSCYAFGANLAVIYLRGEFYEGARIMEKAVAAAGSAGLVGEHILGTDYSLRILVHRGAGAYICGEESALLESIEGKRGHPRVRPPFPAVAGLYGQPTVVNNVETICNVPGIVNNGGAWFAGIGSPKSPGTKICSVSGHVRRPGNYELVMGTPLRELIEEHAGGIREGHALKMILPAGASSAAMTPDKLDTPLDFDAMAAAGTMLGSAGMIVCDETTCAVHVALIGERFYAHESCGKCTPCREGTTWVEKVLARLEAGEGRPSDVDLLKSLVGEIGGGKCLCPLGDFAVTYLGSALRLFEDEFVAHAHGHTCAHALAGAVAR